MNYYLAEGTTQRGPFTAEELPAAGLRPDSMVWREGLPEWQPASQVPELRAILYPPQPVPSGGVEPLPPVAAAPPVSAPAYTLPGMSAYPSLADISGKKIAAGVCGILIGTFGVHKFILGLTGGAVTMLVVSLVALVLTPFTCGASMFVLPVMHVIGLVEGIMYLCKPDAEFYQTYFIEKRQWF